MTEGGGVSGWLVRRVALGVGPVFVERPSGDRPREERAAQLTAADAAAMKLI